MPLPTCVNKPADTALAHRAALAETAYKKLRLVWNSSLSRTKKVRLFQSTITPVLMYSLEALTLTDKVLHKIDAVFYRLLRRCIGIKASFYSRISNQDVWKQAGEPTPPSKLLNSKQERLPGVCFLSQHKRSSSQYSVLFSLQGSNIDTGQAQREEMPLRARSGYFKTLSSNLAGPQRPFRS